MNFNTVYKNFPAACHYIAVFEFDASLNTLQSAILNALYNLNNTNIPAKILLEKINSDLKVIFEFGIADGLTFSYLNKETLRDYMERMRLNICRIMDFICIIRYYRTINEVNKKFRALRFDYYLLRFIFSRDLFKVKVFHEKGLQRIDAENLIKILVESINLELLEKKENPIKIKSL